MSHWRWGPLPAVLAVLVSCSAAPKAANRDTFEARATAHLLAIPPPRPEKYRGLIDMRGWRNPYLVIRKDGVGLLDVANHEQRLMKPEDLIQALAQLPASAWPYGRVVAVTQNGLTSPEDDVLIRKNRAIVAGTLESMHVLINWVPSG